MGLTKAEVEFLGALAQAMGWKPDPDNRIPGTFYTEKPAPTYRVVDQTRGTDVHILFQRLRWKEGMIFRGNERVTVWTVHFAEWNPLESLDDAWDLVEAMKGEASISFALWFPRIKLNRNRAYHARQICLAAANAWGISTELAR